ncbi:PAS domain S-box protein (plasmid) [Citrobacter freundii]
MFSLNLQRSAISYDAICQNKPVIEFSPEGVINKASPLFLSTMGYRADEIIGHHHRIFCPPSLVNIKKTGIYLPMFWQRLFSRGQH